jgi:uncharacterized protein DUF4623/PEP-CTERM motif-containing protein
MTRLLTFGGVDGWLAPAEPNTPVGDPNPYLTTGSTERGLAYDSATAHLYLVSRAGGVAVRILNAITGEDLGALDTDPSVVTGGFFQLNMIAVAADGAIYAGNMSTNSLNTSFKVYKWENEAALPTVAFDSLASGVPAVGLRIGDSFDVFGTGLNTRAVAGYNVNPGPPEANGYLIVDPGSATATNIAFAGTPPAIGDFRLAVTFTDSDTVIGTQGGPVRLTSYVGGTGTLDATLTLATANERPMDYAIVAGIPLLATVETGSGATASTVRVYDMTDPTRPLQVASDKIATSANLNDNLTGQVTWGAVVGKTATLYAMNSNNGIQAFTVTVPEPSTAGLLSGAAALLACRRRR